ncbi:MAG TPA: polyprenyl synthetase family protein [Chryseolinea sp.]
MPAHDAFLDKLRYYRDLSTQALISSIPNREPKKYLYDLIPEYPTRGGKGFRPSLCISTCRIFGGTELEAIRSSVALELFHNAFLVHDDVEDESEARRGLPTLNAAYGNGIAVNVGDAMNVISLRPLMENVFTLGPRVAWDVFGEVEHMVLESVEGQAMELGWRRDNVVDLTDDDYLRMVLKKTCWYTCMHPIRIGALLGSKSKVDVSSFDRFGFYLGAAFQIQDDLLNLIGDKDKYGKEICGDVLEGKRTLMLIHLLNHTKGKTKKHLVEYLSRARSERSLEEMRWILKLMMKTGSLEHGIKSAKNLAGAALKEFFTAFGMKPDNEHRQFLENMILYMISRDY